MVDSDQIAPEGALLNSTPEGNFCVAAKGMEMSDNSAATLSHYWLKFYVSFHVIACQNYETLTYRNDSKFSDTRPG